VPNKCSNCIKKIKRKIYKSRKRIFCNQKCYSKFRKLKLPFEEQHAYKGIRKENESKYIYYTRYVRSHPERIAHLKARRYARQRNAEGSHTFEEWQDLCQKNKWKCANCKEKKQLTKDHIIPLSEKGTDYISNIQPLCRSCNSRKWKFIYENKELIN